MYYSSCREVEEARLQLAAMLQRYIEPLPNSIMNRSRVFDAICENSATRLWFLARAGGFTREEIVTGNLAVGMEVPE